MKLENMSLRHQMNKKIGLFGGTFDPIHLGHISSVNQTIQALKLDKMIVMPAFRSPHRQFEDNSLEAGYRLEMVRKAFRGADHVEVSDQEISRGGVSYTIDTINFLLETYQETEFFLIIGPDQFEVFHEWKDYAKILNSVNLVVTSRPGYEVSVEDNKALRGMIEVQTEERENLTSCRLKNGKKVHVLFLEDVDVSSSEIRKKFRAGEKVNHLLNPDVLNFIESERLYPPITDFMDNVEAFAKYCARVLSDGKALNIIGKDMRGEERPMEFVVIASGTSRKHATSLAEKLVRQVRTEFKLHPLHVEGGQEGQWVAVDYGPLIVHIFYDFTRQEYKLEELWKKSKDLDLADIINS